MKRFLLTGVCCLALTGCAGLPDSDAAHANVAHVCRTWTTTSVAYGSCMADEGYGQGAAPSPEQIAQQCADRTVAVHGRKWADEIAREPEFIQCLADYGYIRDFGGWTEEPPPPPSPPSPPPQESASLSPPPPPPPPPPPAASLSSPDAPIEIELTADHGGYELLVAINGSAPQMFLLDTGATLISLPQDLADALRAAGTLTSADYRGEGVSVIADGSLHTESRYLLRSVSLPGVVVNDVLCSIGPAGSEPLLGNAFLSRFHSVAIDTAKPSLVLR
jgi:hypothetical protein